MARTRCGCGGTGGDGCHPRQASATESLYSALEASVPQPRVARRVVTTPVVLPAARYAELMSAAFSVGLSVGDSATPKERYSELSRPSPLAAQIVGIEEVVE